MDSQKTGESEGLSDTERGLLRDSVRDLLARHWPAERAVEAAQDTGAIATIWRDLAGQGLAALGGGPTGLREAVLVFEELGRASCPAPLLGALAANLLIGNEQSNSATAFLRDLHDGRAMVALALGAFDGDPGAGGIKLHDGTVSGTVSFVEGAVAATHHLVLADGGVARAW